MPPPSCGEPISMVMCTGEWKNSSALQRRGGRNVRLTHLKAPSHGVAVCRTLAPAPVESVCYREEFIQEGPWAYDEICRSSL
eukprot:NODE_19055_length_862_cov_2.952381.p3 GENE.NODE_19055_length_862_cov_2.952381~~NODE_19055_length_862_cov_2.952381.p3  ORF type:complete len:82 (-),score=11.14 NODE_19055_length_862_cov_2.952381:286-531(-)